MAIFLLEPRDKSRNNADRFSRLFVFIQYFLIYICVIAFMNHGRSKSGISMKVVVLIEKVVHRPISGFNS